MSAHAPSGTAGIELFRSNPDGSWNDPGFISSHVWQPAMIIPGQANQTSAFQYKKTTSGDGNGSNNQKAATGFVTPAGSVLIGVWDGDGTGGRPIIYRRAPGSTAWWPSACRNYNFTTPSGWPDLPWNLDATHTIAPAIGDTGMWSSYYGQGGGGIIEAPVIEISPGVLGVPIYGARAEDAYVASVNLLVSLNDGQTWSLRAKVSPDGVSETRYQEPNMIKLHDGTLYMMIRVRHTITDVNTGNLIPYFDRSYTTSTDGGFTWSPLTTIPFTGGGSGRPALIEVANSNSPSGYTILHLIRPNDFARMMTWVGSNDGGITWTNPKMFSPGAGVLPGVPGPGGWSVYAQFIQIQRQIEDVQDGKVAVIFFHESNSGLPDTIGGVACGYCNYITIPA